MRAAIIFNPSAGKGVGNRIASAVENGLVNRGLDTELHATGGPGNATALARRLVSQVDILVAVGGDGTVNEVANGMGGADDAPSPGRRARLGIVPAGTVNVLARELRLPFRIEEACDVISRGNTLSMDLGDVNGRGFVLMTGAGVDALTVRHVDRRAKRRYKELAFIATGLRQGFAAPQPEFLVRAAGREYRATFFVAGNSRYYAGGLSITRSADPTDGLLDLVLFTGTSRLSLAVFWLQIPTGIHLRNRNVTYLRAKEAELVPVDASKTIWFQTDGELAGTLPAKVKVHPHALDVLVP